MALLNRESKRDFTPDVRVIIEVKKPVSVRETVTFASGTWGYAEDGSIYQIPTQLHLGDTADDTLKATVEGYTRQAGELIEIDMTGGGILDVTTNYSINAPGTATFVVANPQDKYYTNAKLNPLKRTRQEQVADYLREVVKISALTERNWERTEEFWRLANKGQVSRNLSKYVDELENGVITSATAPGSREDEYALYQFYTNEFALMNRVWIDYKNRNDEWVAGFTGFISTVNKSDTVQSVPTITVRCKSMMSVLQRSEIAVAAAIDLRFEPMESEDVIEKTMLSFTNSLAGKNGVEVIEAVVRQVRDLNCYNSGDVSLKKPSNYYHADKLWQMQGDNYPVPILSKFMTASPILDDNIGYGPSGIGANPLREFVKGTTVESMNGKLVLDPKLMEGEAFEVFKKMLRTSFSLYQNTVQTGYLLCREVASIVGYDWYDDPKGNLIFQIPRYDSLPRFDSAASDKYGADYSDVPFHERDYILDDIGLMNTTYDNTEQGLFTFASVYGNMHFLSIDDVVKAQGWFGTTAPKQLEEFNSELADNVRRSLRRFGVRRTQLKSLLTGLPSSNMLARYAYMQLQRGNATTKSGTINMTQRPDIWPGRTVFMVEAQKLAYVIGTSNNVNFNSKSPHSTTLALSYVHHPSEVIGVPWLDSLETAKREEIRESILLQEWSPDYLP